MKITKYLMMLVLTLSLAAAQPQKAPTGADAKKAATTKVADLVDLNSATTDQPESATWNWKRLRR